jgi:predicted AAA+ superfamily ATPase
MENAMEIKRDYYLNKLIEAKNDGLIKVITGIRRCGKSYLLNTIFYNHLRENGIDENHIIRVAFENPQYDNLLNPQNLINFIKEQITDKECYFCLLDEIQLVNNFEGVLNGLLGTENVDIYVTGSNSKFLSTDIITEFRGRGEEIRIYPLSYSEFMSVYVGDKLDGWVEYVTYGGLPLVLSMKSDERKMAYLKEQKQNVYINDVLERNNIKNDSELVNLVEIISSSIGSLSNPKKISDTFKSTAGISIEPKTISAYLKYLEEAFLIEKSNRYDVKGKKYMNTPYKFYFCDIGLRNSFINFRQQEETHIMENVIYLELKRRCFNVDVGVIELKTTKESEQIYKQLEIDFIANKGNNKFYIQSAFSMPTPEKAEQEIRPFKQVNDSFKKFIIVKDYIKRNRDENGIITMSIFDFLLDINSLEY